VHPGPERAAAVEAVDRPDRGEECLLGDVLGGRGVVDHQVRGAVRAGPLAPKQLLKRLGRSPLNVAHQPPLGATRFARLAREERCRPRRGRNQGRWLVAGHGCR
jgi:hypothetical protein